MIGLKSDKNNLCANWNSHKALKSISLNPRLHRSCALVKKFPFVLKNIVSGIYLPPMHGQLITAAVLQFSLDFSTCPKTGTLCVKVGPKPVFIPLSNICIQSYNFPGLLVEYIINMQQDPNALFSQSLGASSNSKNKNCANVGRELFVLLLFWSRSVLAL